MNKHLNNIYCECWSRVILTQQQGAAFNLIFFLPFSKITWKSNISFISLTSVLTSVCLTSHESCQYHFKLTNHGLRVHRMYWRTDGFQSSTKLNNRDSPTILPAISTPKKKGCRSFLSSGTEKPVFSITPSRVELFPGCSADMVLTGTSNTSKVSLKCK